MVGAESLTIAGDEVLTSDGARIGAGEVITLDGTSGCIWKGAINGGEDDGTDAVAESLPQLLRIEQWAQSLEATPA